MSKGKPPRIGKCTRGVLEEDPLNERMATRVGIVDAKTGEKIMDNIDKRKKRRSWRVCLQQHCSYKIILIVQGKKKKRVNIWAWREIQSAKIETHAAHKLSGGSAGLRRFESKHQRVVKNNVCTAG